MTRVLLMRHGATDQMKHVLCGRMPGIHLNSLGHQQAEQLAKGVAKELRIDQLVSSPLERATETAGIISSVVGIPVQVDGGWTELDYGDWTGEDVDSIRNSDSWHCYNRSRSTGAPPGGEALTQVQARAFESLQRVIRLGAERPFIVAVVSHGDVIRSLLALVLGIPLDHLHRFEVAPASVSEVLIGAQEAKVSYVNRTYGEPE